MSFEFVSLLDYGLGPAAEVLARGFSDYFVRIPASPALLVQMARVDSVDLTASKVVLRAGVALGAALVARRGWTCRVAGMAIVPEGRRQGAGRAAVRHLLDAARARGDRAMVLEVIEQNEPAVKLYEEFGFRRARRLVGFSRLAEAAPAPDSFAAGLEEVDLRTVAAALVAGGLRDWPWQLSGETVAQLSPPHRGFQLGAAWLAISGEASPQVGVRALVADGLAREPGPGVELLRAVMARYPGREWRIGALWPEELAAVFTAAGFARTPLSQWQMERPTAES